MKTIAILILFIPILSINYDLVNGVQKKIYSLNSSETYSFYFDTFQYQNLSISLNMSYMSPKPFTYSYIYEYESRYSSSSLINSSQSFSTTTKNNELTSSFTYSVKNVNTKYIALKITPNYNINYIVVSINAEGVYDLSNGLPKNVTTLKSGIPYYFFLPSSYLQTAFINLNISYMSSKPFTYSYIYEYSTKYSSTYLTYNSQYLSTTTKNNELTSSFTYSVKNVNTKYIALKFTPNYNINYIVAKFDIKNYKYELSYNGAKQTIYNLNSQNKYYLFIKMNNKSKIKVTLTMDYSYYNSLSFLYIYELIDYINGLDSYYNKVYKDVTIDNKDSQSIISFTYTTSHSNIEYVVLEITPNNDITYLKSEFEYVSSLSTGIIVLIVFICLFVFIIIIICIIKRRRKHSKNSNLFENSTIHPLYPNNESLSNQQQNYSFSQQQYIQPPNQPYYQNQQAYYQPQQLYNLPQQQYYQPQQQYNQTQQINGQ